MRHLGSSNFSSQQIEDADRIAHELGLTRFVAAQNQYSLVERGIEDDVLPVCERLGIGMLPYFPLASGLLTGKYKHGVEATEGRLAGREIPEERWTRLEALQRFAEERGVPLLSVAVGGLAAMPAVASVIAGATKPEQVRANVGRARSRPEDSRLNELLLYLSRCDKPDGRETATRGRRRGSEAGQREGRPAGYDAQRAAITSGRRSARNGRANPTSGARSRA